MSSFLGSIAISSEAKRDHGSHGSIRPCSLSRLPSSFLPLHLSCLSLLIFPVPVSSPITSRHFSELVTALPLTQIMSHVREHGGTEGSDEHACIASLAEVTSWSAAGGHQFWEKWEWYRSAAPPAGDARRASSSFLPQLLLPHVLLPWFCFFIGSHRHGLGIGTIAVPPSTSWMLHVPALSQWLDYFQCTWQANKGIIRTCRRS